MTLQNFTMEEIVAKRMEFLSLSDSEKMKHCVFCGEKFISPICGHINCGGILLDIEVPNTEKEDAIMAKETFHDFWTNFGQRWIENGDSAEYVALLTWHAAKASIVTDLQRYDLVHTTESFQDDHFMEECSSGDWVKFEDLA